MNKKQFSELINYLKNRPSECESLLCVLTGSLDSIVPHNVHPGSVEPSEVPGNWLSAREVGNQIGMSSRWVRERLHLLPDDQVMQKSIGTKKMWYINFSVCGPQLKRMKMI